MMCIVKAESVSEKMSGIDGATYYDHDLYMHVVLYFHVLERVKVHSLLKDLKSDTVKKDAECGSHQGVWKTIEDAVVKSETDIPRHSATEAARLGKDGHRLRLGSSRCQRTSAWPARSSRARLTNQNCLACASPLRSSRLRQGRRRSGRAHA